MSTLKFFYCSLFFLWPIISWSQIINLDTSNISIDLRKDVDAVTRYDQTTIEVSKNGKEATIIRRYAVTIFNRNATDLATVVEQYGDLNKIVKIDGALYDASGKLIRKLRNSDIEDIAPSDGMSIASDSRIQYASLFAGVYPFTVEFETEIIDRNLAFFPKWIPLHNESQSIQSASLTVKVPKEITLYHKSLNQAQPIIQTLDDGASYQWKIQDITPFVFEPYNHELKYYVPIVYMNLSQFEVAKYEGSGSSWNEVGKWMAALAKDRDVLPAKTAKEIKALTTGLPTTEAKVKAIYEYLQDHSRYVSIQLGIGGYQPFEAAFVDKNGYGDCKALSNYTKAMLKSVNIPSNLVVVYADDFNSSLEEDFPQLSHFNHMVLCVPNGQDSIWLECTSQSNPFAFMGFSTANRKALLITENGGYLANTPRYDESTDLIKSNVEVAFNQDGSASIAVLTEMTGAKFSYLNMVAKGTEDIRKSWIDHELDNLTKYELQSEQFEVTKSRLPVAKAAYTVTSPSVAVFSPNRAYFDLNLLQNTVEIPATVVDRKQPLILKNGYTEEDRVVYKVPSFYRAEYLPEPIKISNQFGTYEQQTTYEPGKLIFTRKYVQRMGTHPKEAYEQFIDFMRTVAKADRSKAVLVRKS